MIVPLPLAALLGVVLVTPSLARPTQCALRQAKNSTVNQGIHISALSQAVAAQSAGNPAETSTGPVDSVTEIGTAGSKTPLDAVALLGGGGGRLGMTTTSTIVVTTHVGIPATAEMLSAQTGKGLVPSRVDTSSVATATSESSLPAQPSTSAAASGAVVSRSSSHP